MIYAMCALLMHEALYGPLADIPTESMGTCTGDVCVVYWTESRECEEVEVNLTKRKDV